MQRALQDAHAVRYTLRCTQGMLTIRSLGAPRSAGRARHAPRTALCRGRRGTEGAGTAEIAALVEMIWWEKAATRTSRAVTGATRRTSAGVDVVTLRGWAQCVYLLKPCKAVGESLVQLCARRKSA